MSYMDDVYSRRIVEWLLVTQSHALTKFDFTIYIIDSHVTTFMALQASI